MGPGKCSYIFADCITIRNIKDFTFYQSIILDDYFGFSISVVTNVLLY